MSRPVLALGALLIAGAAFFAIAAPGSEDQKSKKPQKAKKDKNQPDEKKAWVPLFNGKDLTGWEVFPKGTGPWKVEKGILIGTGPKGSHLFTKKGTYRNFRYRIEAKISDKGNSGQYFRTQFGPGYPKGYEAQINSTHPDPVKTGSLYGFVAVKEMLIKPDAWFTQEVIADKNHIIIKVNGKTTVDFVDKNNTYKQGRFALQLHDPTGGVETTVQFRKIEVMELPPTAGKAAD